MARNYIQGKFYCHKGSNDHFHSSQSEVQQCNDLYAQQEQNRHKQAMQKGEIQQQSIRLGQMEQANKYLEMGGANRAIGYNSDPAVKMLTYRY